MSKEFEIIKAYSYIDVRTLVVISLYISGGIINHDQIWIYTIIDHMYTVLEFLSSGFCCLAVLN